MSYNSSNRIIGYDFARALAILGMIIVNYKLALEVVQSPHWLAVFTSLFEGRAAAMFVILAGVGISLMTRKARASNDSLDIKEVRIVILKRSFFLFIFGLFLYVLGWSADILHYYGVYLLLAALIFTQSNRVIWLSNLGVLLITQIMHFSLNYQVGWDGEFFNNIDFWSLTGFIRNLFFNGYHPIFPWISFILVGLWLGRQDLLQKKVRAKILKYALFITVFTEAFSKVLTNFFSDIMGHEISSYLFSTKPMPPSIFYIIAASSTAVVIITICVALTEKYKDAMSVNALILTGQMALTHYVAHVFIGLGLLELTGLIQSSSLIFSVAYSLLIYLLMIIFSNLFRNRFTRGPLELLMRKIC